jgi:ATP-dependent DNA helicase PIF1
MLVSNIKVHSPRAELLRQASVIIIDEAPSGNKAVYSCIDDVLQLVTGKEIPFGGKIVVLVGDFRQCCPVVPGGNRMQAVDASLRSSTLWPLFSIEKLSIPIRNAADPEYAAFVDGIGDGEGPIVQLPNLNITHSEEELLDFVWPQIFIDNPYAGSARCILAVTNKQVNVFNQKALSKLQRGFRTYLASDSILETTDTEVENILEDAESSLLDYYSSHEISGFPQHSLILKIGCFCRLLRNMSIDIGLVKNTRVVVTGLGNHVISIRKILTPGTFIEQSNRNKDILLPRITFIHHLHSGHTLRHRQFPLTLAYATTFNSCQGLTLDAVGCDLRLPAFSHGQLYVALSRIRRRENAKILIQEDTNTTTNVTYQELLLPD